MVRALSLSLSLALAAAAAVLGLFAASAGAATFRTPSGNISCLYTPASGSASVSLRCDLASVAHAPQRPASCHQVWGQAFLLFGTGRAKRGCVGDTIVDRGATTLRYGVKRKYGPFTCTSRQRGLTCTSRYGHGFTLSKAKQKLW